MSEITKNDKTVSADASGLVPLATLALVSTYIADARPEGDRLGWWAEIAQAVSVSFLVIGAVLFVVVTALAAGLLLFARGERTTKYTGPRVRRRGR